MTSKIHAEVDLEVLVPVQIKMGFFVETDNHNHFTKDIKKWYNGNPTDNFAYVSEEVKEIRLPDVQQYLYNLLEDNGLRGTVINIEVTDSR